METSAPDVYAVGDAVQVKHQVTGKDAVISLAGPANKQGRIVADVIAGLNSRYKGSLGSSVIKVFDLTVANTGLSEKAASAAGYQYGSVVLSPGSHAGYYPGAVPMTIKLAYSEPAPLNTCSGKPSRTISDPVTHVDSSVFCRHEVVCYRKSAQSLMTRLSLQRERE